MTDAKVAALGALAIVALVIWVHNLMPVLK